MASRLPRAGARLRALSRRERTVEIEQLRLRVAQLEDAVRQHTTRAEHSEDLGPLLFRTDLLERGAELAPVLARRYAIPRESGRRAVVTREWPDNAERRVLCSAGTGPYIDLMAVTEQTLADHARRHRWDFIVEQDVDRPVPPFWLKFALVRELLDAHDIVAWIDADAIIVDPMADLATALETPADVYVTEPTAAAGQPPTVDSGVLVCRAGGPVRQLLDELLSRPVGDPDVALTSLLQRHSAPWRVAWLNRTWDSIPSGARERRPYVLHYASMPRPHRRDGLVAAAADVLMSNADVADLVDDVATREELPRLLNRLGLLGTGVEIGVRNGAFSAWLLHRWQGFRLVSVDPWQTSRDDEYVDIANVSQSRHDDLLVQTRHRLSPFGPRNEIWRVSSAVAAEEIASATLDFVYLDARHDEASVEEDLSLWYPKLVSGGIIAGHDYLDGDLPEGRFGVKTAVDRFFGQLDHYVHTTTADAPWKSWFVIVDSS